MFKITRASLNNLAKADVITAVLQETGVDYLLFGRDALKRFRRARRIAERTGQPCKLDRLFILRLTVRDADEMEALAYTVEMMKTFASVN